MTDVPGGSTGIDAEKQQQLRALPSVDELLNDPIFSPVMEMIPHDAMVFAIRKVLDDHRKRILEGDPDISSEIIVDVLRVVDSLASPSLRPAVNATGIVIHTNLGRSPLSEAAVEAVADVASGYSTLEYDTQERGRGSRHSHLENLLCFLTGAEAAIAVNNNAAAVMLVLSEFAKGREAVISRSELVEIGGSFRIPDIMALSGAHMREVGTTNKTHLADYERAIDDDTAMLMRVHPSNFRIIGFTESVPTRDLRELADRVNAEREQRGDGPSGILVYEDQGSGCLIDPVRFGLDHEPTVPEALALGCDLVSFSGDKLLGGAQAGIIVGKAELIARLKRNPLVRALRLDKMTIAALEATFELYLDPDKALREIPTLHMLSKTLDEIRNEAEDLARDLSGSIGTDLAVFDVEHTAGQSGGGSLPECEVESYAVSVSFEKGDAESCYAYLISDRETPVIARIGKDRLLFDVRTLLPGDHREVMEGLEGYFANV